MQNKNSYIKEAGKNYFKTLKKSLPFLGLFTLVVLALWLFQFVMAMYGYSLGFMGIILLGLLIVPLYFAAQVCVFMINQDGRDVPYQHFLNLFKLYFKPNFMGIYRVIRTILLSMLWALVAMFAFTIIYFSFAQYFDPGIITAMETFTSYSNAGDSEAAINFLETSESFIRFVDIVTYVSSTAEAAGFLFYMARNSAVMYIGEVVMAPSPKFVVDTYKNTFRGRHVPDYNKEFFKGTWFIFLAFLVVYVAGTVVGFYLFEGNPLQWVLMSNLGLGFSLVILPFTLPYFFLFLANLVIDNKKKFFESAFELIKFSFQEMKARGMFQNQEDEEKFKEGVKSYEEAVKEEGKEPLDAEAKEKDEKINTDDYGSSDHHE